MIDIVVFFGHLLWFIIRLFYHAAVFLFEIGITPLAMIRNAAEPYFSLTSIAVIDSLIYSFMGFIGFCLMVLLKKFDLVNKESIFILSFLVFLTTLYLVMQWWFWVLLVLALVMGAPFAVKKIGY